MIRNRRRDLGMSAETLAEKCNRSDREVLSIERGNSEPLFGTAMLMCKACDIDIGHLTQFASWEGSANV